MRGVGTHDLRASFPNLGGGDFMSDRSPNGGNIFKNPYFWVALALLLAIAANWLQML